MNNETKRTIRSLLLLAGLTNSLSIRFVTVKGVIRSFVSSILSVALATQKRVLAAMTRFTPTQLAMKRSGITAAEGYGLIVTIIFLVVALYVAAFSLPGALTAIATTALTSVNAGVQTLFQQLIPLVAVIVIVLILVGVVRAIL